MNQHSTGGTGMEALMTTESEVRRLLNAHAADHESHGECARCRKIDPEKLLAYTEICDTCHSEVYADL